MKKVIALFSIVGLIAFSGCKKDWVCECTDQSNNKSYENIPNASLKDANRTCNNFEYSVGPAYKNCSVIK